MSAGTRQSPKIQTVALIGKQHSPEVAEALRPLADFLRGRGVEVLVEESTAADGGGLPVVDYAAIGARADVAVVIGGDGTMLNAARQLAEFGVPLVGVNLGRLGFMTDIARKDMLAGAEDLLAGRFSAEQRLLLASAVLRGGESVFRTEAFNEVVVSKGDVGRMIELEVRVDGEFLYVLRADGMIVATPTGSTAYALSANGPILQPAVPGIALVPLSPHALSYRPITISDRSSVELTLLAPHDGAAHFDGQARFATHAGDCVRITRSPHTVTLLHPPGYSYFAMLREKLHWSATPRH
jgi:NAD+ kinase